MTAVPCRASQIASGFRNPVLDSQACFRALLEAMAHPGRIIDMSADLNPSPPLATASFAAILTLCDHETPLWLDDVARAADIASSLRFHCGVALVEDRAEAAFALCLSAMPDLAGFNSGTADFPERSATLVLQVSGFGRGSSYRLRGPGIDGEANLQVEGLPEDFIAQWAANRALFPQGIDLILTHGRSLSALPRSLVVEREA